MAMALMFLGAFFFALSIANLGWQVILSRRTYWRYPFFQADTLGTLVLGFVFFGYGLLVRHLAKRASAGHCARCGYDLTGNVSGICPECGHAISR
jgi:hypothetical protein